MCLLNLSVRLIKVMRRNESTSLLFWSPCTVLYLWSAVAYELPSALLAHSWGVLKTVSTCILIAWVLAMIGHDSGKLARPEFSPRAWLCQKTIMSFQREIATNSFAKPWALTALLLVTQMVLLEPNRASFGYGCRPAQFTYYSKCNITFPLVLLCVSLPHSCHAGCYN